MSAGYRDEWMSDDQWECAQLFAGVMGGFHHCGQFKEWGRGIAISEDACKFATFDFGYLTSLVFAAHDKCIRVEIASSGPRMVKFILFKRHKREGCMSERHPTLEQAIAVWRRNNPENPHA